VALVGLVVVAVWLPRHSAAQTPVPASADDERRELADVTG
jgi:hypothetical protein